MISLSKKKKKKPKSKQTLKAKLNKAIEDYNKKLIKERDNKEQEFQRILKRIEETEKKKADLEIEQYRNEQKRKLEEKIVNVTDFKEEKEKMQNEITVRYNALKQEYQLKIEEEKKKIEDEIYKEESKRYELELEMIKNEFNKKQAQAGDLESLKKKLEQELKDKLDEIEAENKFKIAQETLKLDIEKEKILEEYEEKLKSEADKEIENIKNSNNYLVNEQREDKNKKIKEQYHHKLKDLEEEKTRKIIEIQSSFRNLNLNSENSEISKNLQDALKEQNLIEIQKDLEYKIEQVTESIEDLKQKSKEISNEIIELNKQILSKEKIRDSDKGSKIRNLKEQIAKTDEDIKKAEQEYQRLIEESKARQEYDYIEDSDLNERVDFDDDSGHSNKLAAEYSKPSLQNRQEYGNISLEKLANDISEIKTLIEDSGIGRTKMKDYLLDVEEFRRREDTRKEKSYVDERMYGRREEQASDKSRILERVRTNLEKQIDELNEKVNYIKQKEELLKGTKRDYADDTM